MRTATIAGWMLLFAVTLAPAAARAQDQPARAGTPGHTKEWNSGEVAALAEQLNVAVTDARRYAKRMPSPGIQAGQDVTWYHFNDKLRLIANEARQLNKAAAGGATQEQLLPIYQRMWSWIRDAQDSAKKMMIPQDLDEKIQASRAVLEQLDAYFD